MSILELEKHWIEGEPCLQTGGNSARLTEPESTKWALEKQCKDAEAQIEGLPDRIVDASSPTVVTAYGKRLAKLEREKIRLADRASRIVPPKGRFEECIEPSLEFLARHWNIYENGSLAIKRTVLRLAFPKPLRHSRENGYRTIKTAFPFKVLAESCNQRSEMVHLVYEDKQGHYRVDGALAEPLGEGGDCLPIPGRAEILRVTGDQAP